MSQATEVLIHYERDRVIKSFCIDRLAAWKFDREQKPGLLLAIFLWTCDGERLAKL